MKCIIFLLSFSFYCGISFSQVYTPEHPTVYGQHQLRGKWDSALNVPEKSILATNTFDTSAQIFYHKPDSSFYGWSRARGFFKINGSSSTSTGGSGKIYNIYAQKPLYIYYNNNGDTIIAIESSDGFIVKPVISYSGFGLVYNATPGAYNIGGKYYQSPATTITLDPADSVYSTQYVFVSDTNGITRAIRGIPASLPLLPADTLGYQLPITSGITIGAGATTPSTVLATVYDEGIGEPGEWTYADNGGVNAFTTNTANFFTGSKSTLVSTYNTNSRFYWYDNVDHSQNNNDVLNYHIWLNQPMTNSIYMVYLDHVGLASNYVRLGTAQGFNPQLTNQWQNISLPNTQFNWVSNKFDAIGFEMVGSDVSGAGGFYVDYINIQGGNNLPNPTDYSNKPDSLPLRKVIVGSDTLNIRDTWVKGLIVYSDTIYTKPGGTSVVKQTHTIGATVTVSNTTTWLIVNPATILSALAITLPASPTDGQDVLINFGGTITSGGVVNAITISPAPIDASTPDYVEAGEHIAYRWNSTNSLWYRTN